MVELEQNAVLDGLMSAESLVRFIDDASLVIDKLESLVIKGFRLASLVYFLYKIAAHL